MKISTIGFYGIRNIGPGLVQTLAARGMHSVVYEKNDDIYHNAVSLIESNVEYEIAHWGMTRKDKKVMMSRIEHIDSSDELFKKDIDILIESVEENIEVKKHTIDKIKDKLNLNIPVILTSQINRLEDILPDDSISGRCVNIHPVPSVPVYKLIEMTRHKNTSDVTIEIIEGFMDKLDLEIIEIPDCAGGIGPRIFVSTVLEACSAFERAGVDFKSADDIMKKGLRMYKGPLTMADELGLHTVKMWIDEMSKFDPEAYKMPGILTKLMGGGYTGAGKDEGFLKE